MDTVSLEMTLQVEYIPNTTSKDELKRLLEDAASHLASRGLLTGESDAEVKTWIANVRDDEDFEENRCHFCDNGTVI